MSPIKGSLLIAHPSVRTMAYLSVLKQEKLLPEHIIWMNNGMFEPPENLVSDWNQFKYDRFFSLSGTWNNKKLAAQHYYSVGNDINHDSVKVLLLKILPSMIIFSGGGIVSDSLLNCTSAKWLHFHPGELPEYRGSTCFYYSYLNEESLCCSAFWLSSNLDEGELLQSAKYELNYPLGNEESHFLDYVLDPFIRSQTLKTLCGKLANFKAKGFKSEPENSLKPYYVIHPLLRSLCAKMIQKNYDPNKEIELILLDSSGVGNEE